MKIGELIKNPIVFGGVVGILLCLILFIYEKYLSKKTDDKSGFSTYFKLFLAGFIVTAPLVFLVFNRNLSFKTDATLPVEEVTTPVMSGGTNIEEIVANADKEVAGVFTDEMSTISQISQSTGRKPKRVHNNIPYVK